MTETGPRPDYVEPAARYTSSWILGTFVVVGFAADSARAGRVTHLLGWAIAGLLIVGINVLIIRAARTLRSVTVTADQVRVGEQWIERAHIAAIDDSDIPGHVLGQTPHTALPRGIPGLRLRLVDGAVAVVPTRHPDRLAQVLGLHRPDRLVVRDATPADWDLLIAVDERAATLYRVAGIDAPEPLTADVLQDADAVLVCGDPPIGFVSVAAQDGVARITALAVLPPRMRTGIGAALVGAVASWAGAHGCAEVSAATQDDAPWQDQFFRACGYERDGTLFRRVLASEAPSG